MEKFSTESQARELAEQQADPVAYVLSLNLHRRHLTPSQAAMVAARAREFYDKAAKERQKEHGGTAPGRPRTLQANLPEVNKRQARDQAAKAVGVGGRTVDYATRVLKHGVPELVKVVESGQRMEAPNQRSECEPCLTQSTSTTKRPTSSR